MEYILYSLFVYVYILRDAVMYCNIVLYCIRQKMMRKQVRCLSPPLLLWMSQNHRNTPPLIIRNLCMYHAVFHSKKCFIIFIKLEIIVVVTSDGEVSLLLMEKCHFS